MSDTTSRRRTCSRGTEFNGQARVQSQKKEDRLKESINLVYGRCHHIFSAIFDWILFIFAGNEDMYKSLNEFEIRPDATTGFYCNR